MGKHYSLSGVRAAGERSAMFHASCIRATIPLVPAPFFAGLCEVISANRDVISGNRDVISGNRDVISTCDVISELRKDSVATSIYNPGLLS